MKIVVTTPSFPPIVGGLGNAIYEQVLLLQKMGHDLTVVTSTTGDEYRPKNYLGINVKEFNIEGADWIIRPIKGQKNEYISYLKSGKFDLIIMHAWQNWATDLVIKFIDEIPGKKILHSHCVSTNEFYANQPLRSVIRYMAWRPYFMRMQSVISKLDAIIFLANVENETRFLDLVLAHNTSTPVYFIPNCLPFYSNNSLLEVSSPLNSRNSFICVGSYEWQKGFDFVIKAYAHSRYKNIIPLKIFGQRYTDYTNKLMMLSHNEGILSDYIRFSEGITGKQLIDEYKTSLLLLSGSYTECQPMTVLDAMATGTPFVCRKTGCLSVLNGGIVVTSIDEMSLVIDGILNSDKQWNMLSEEGSSYAKKMFEPSVIAEKLHALVTDIVK